MLGKTQEREIREGGKKRERRREEKGERKTFVY